SLSLLHRDIQRRGKFPSPHPVGHCVTAHLGDRAKGLAVGVILLGSEEDFTRQVMGIDTRLESLDELRITGEGGNGAGVRSAVVHLNHLVPRVGNEVLLLLAATCAGAPNGQPRAGDTGTARTLERGDLRVDPSVLPGRVERKLSERPLSL